MAGHTLECRSCGRHLAALCIALLPCTSVAAQQTTAYNYDALGRLTSVSSPQANASYRYDAAGNRQQVTVQAAAPVTLNGDFEVPQVGTYAYAPSAPDLVFSGQAGIAANGSDWGFPQPWRNRQVAFLQASSSGIGSVDVRAIRLIVGKRYQVTFAAAQRPGYPVNNVHVSVDGQDLWDGVPPTADRFTAQKTPAFMAASSTAVIRFQSSPTSYDSASGIDSVSVRQLD